MKDLVSKSHGFETSSYYLTWVFSHDSRPYLYLFMEKDFRNPFLEQTMKTAKFVFETFYASFDPPPSPSPSSYS